MACCTLLPWPRHVCTRSLQKQASKASEQRLVNSVTPLCVPPLMSQDVYDKKRQGLIKQLKADALAWTSKYARGGSVRAQSAREV